MSMRRSPKLRPTVWDALMAAAVAALALVCAVFVWDGGLGQGDALTAVVTVEGREAERIDLSEPGEDRVYSGGGYTLTVELWPDGERGVRVLTSDCPTQDCVHMGTITRPGRIIIQLEGGGETGGPAGPDVIIG